MSRNTKRSLLIPLAFLAFLPSPGPVTAQGVWCWTLGCQPPSYDQEGLLWDAHSYVNYESEITACEEIYFQLNDLINSENVWVADLPVDTAGGYAEGQDPPVLVDSLAFTYYPFSELVRIVIHEACESLGYGQTACNSYDDDCNGFEGWEQPSSMALQALAQNSSITAEQPNEEREEASPGGPYAPEPVVDPWAPLPIGQERGPRDLAVLAEVTSILTENWPRDRVVLRAREQVDVSMQRLASAFGTTEDECSLTDCVRFPKVVLEFAGLNFAEDGSATCHVSKITLGSDYAPHAEFLQLILVPTPRGEKPWKMVEIKSLMGG